MKLPILLMKEIEKHERDTILFPAFSLEVAVNDIVAIYSNLNVRQTLLDMFIGKQSCAPGEIRVNGLTLLQNKTAYLQDIGLSFLNDGLYERLTVKDYLLFYSHLYESKQTFDQIMQVSQLESKKSTKIEKLSYSEQKRVHFARMMIQNPKIFVFEEPDLNIDVESKRIFLNITKQLQKQGKSVLVLTGNMESAITIADKIYRLDEAGLKLMDLEGETEEKENEKIVEEKELENHLFQFNKIPTKVNDKIVLFDPPEIDYIESHDGQSNIYIKGEAFPSTLTLNKLEERLMPYGFFRCHRSFIVNLQKVREVITWTRNSYSLVLDDKNRSSIPLSKTKMSELKDMLGLK
jgi:ABC-2 type transport system ATP-binding protein